MSLLEHAQDVGRTLHAVDVLSYVRLRLEAFGDERALESLHHFHRLSTSELEILVELETGVRTPSDLRFHEFTSSPSASTANAAEVAA